MKIRKVMKKLGISLFAILLSGGLFLSTNCYAAEMPAEETLLTAPAPEIPVVVPPEVTEQIAESADNSGNQESENIEGEENLEEEEIIQEPEAEATPIDNIEAPEPRKLRLEPSATGSTGTEVENTRLVFEPDEVMGRYRDFSVNVSPELTRFEIFYTASVTPAVTLTPATNKSTKYVLLDNLEYRFPDSPFEIITKPNIRVEGYDDIRYMVIYIKYTSDPGKWNLHVDFPDDTTEFVLCKTINNDWPEDWEELRSDVKTDVQVLSWYIDPTSHYADNIIENINGMISRDYTLADVDTMISEEPVKENNLEKILLLGIILFFIVAAVVGIMIFMSRKKKEEELRQKRANIVAKANAKVRKKKAKEEDELEKVLDDFSDEYIDEDEFSDYFDSTPSEDDEFKEEDVSISLNELGIEKEAIKSPEKDIPVEQTPSWAVTNTSNDSNNSNFYVQKNFSGSEEIQKKPSEEGAPAWANANNNNTGSFF